jgi:hypothetical protein
VRMSELNRLKTKYKDGGKAEKIRNLKKDLETPQASIGPIPRNKAQEFMGTTVAGAARKVRDAMSAEVPVLGGTVGEWVVGDTPEALEDWSYGFGPLRFGRTDVAGRAGALYGMKADPRMLDVAGAVELPYIAGRIGVATAKKGMDAAAEKIGNVMQGRSARTPELEELKEKYQAGGKVGRGIAAGKRLFSAIDQAIETLKQKKGTGEQILKQIESTPGVKQEELETRGIKQALQASPKITQEELQQIAKRNPPPVPKRTVLGGGLPEDYKPKIPEPYQKLLDEYEIEVVVNPDDPKTVAFMHGPTGEIADADLIKQLDPEELGFPVNADGSVTDAAYDDYKDLLKGITYAERQVAADLGKMGTKFSRYAQPGGENYREVLLELPTGMDKATNLKRNRLAELNKQFEGMDPSTIPQEAQNEMFGLIDELAEEPAQFKRGHWDQPNVLAHFRISDRVGPNGEKILFVDEIQSDWHQKARDARKNHIKREIMESDNTIHQKAAQELFEKVGNTNITDENLAEIRKIKNRLKAEMAKDLDKQLPKDFGYMSPEDQQRISELTKRIDYLREEGLNPQEVAEYFTPGKIVKGYGGYDKVLSFNDGTDGSFYKQKFEKSYERALSAGVPEEQARAYATTQAKKESSFDWSVTVVEVDPRTGEPKPGAQPRTHMTNPRDEVLNNLRTELNQYESKLPDAPFKDTWHELAVKEIFDMAANDGYDKVAFSPGIEQVKRYEQGLRQAVDEIKFGQGPDGSTIISGIKGGRSVFSGRVMDGVFVDGPAEGKTLNEVLGKEVSERIENELPDLAGKKAMQDLSADELLLGYGPDLTSDQRDWLRSFTGTWDEVVDGTPEGERSREALMDTYTRWRESQGLTGGPGQSALPISRPMPDLDAEALLMQHGQDLTPDQRSWLNEFIGTWEEAVDDTPAGEGFREELTNSYTMWRQNQMLTSKPAPADQAPMGSIKTDNLTIGGEGMKSFYDKRLPDYVRKYAGKEFDAQTGYMDVPLASPNKGRQMSEDDIRRVMDEIADADDDELMDRTMELQNTQAREALQEVGITPDAEDYDDRLWEVMDEFQDRAREQAAREMAIERLNYNEFWEGDKPPVLKSFTVDVTPKMREKIQSEGQKLFAVPPVLGAIPAAEEVIPGLLPQEEQPEPAQQVPPQPQMPIQVSPDEPEGFSSGGRVGLTKKAAERFLRVLHGSPTKVRPEQGRNMDVTTDSEYAMKRARDKMAGVEGPPMLNKFDIPESRMLRFEEQYSPEDVALMRRFFNKLPQGQAMTGEEIYEAAQGKDYVMEGIAKAGGLAGYQRPAAGSGGKGDWYRVTEPTELKRGMKTGGLAQAFQNPYR